MKDTDTLGTTDVQKATIWHAGQKYTILNIYSPPGTLCNITELQETVFHNTIIAGDFNGHSPLWGYPDHYAATGRYIEDLCETTNLLVSTRCKFATNPFA